MDNPARTVLRPSSKLSDNVHCMGYWRAEDCYPCRRVDISIIREEMVRVQHSMPRISIQNLLPQGPFEEGNTDSCSGRALKQMDH